jgi:hypothetical protein
MSQPLLAPRAGDPATAASPTGPGSRPAILRRAAWSPRRQTLDSLGIGAGCLLLYLLLHREALHPPDAHRFLQQVSAGDVASTHFLYLRLGVAFTAVMRAFGMDVFGSMLCLSALGGSIAAVAGHRTLLSLGASRHQAATGALLAATSPGVFFFATTVEIHAPFLAVANLALWSGAASCTSRGADRWGVVRTGLVTAMATGVHATGHLLLAPIGILFWLRGRRFRDAVTLATSHCVGIVTLSWLVAGGCWPIGASAGALLDGMGSGLLVGEAWRISWNEWLRPFLPVSVLALVALLVSGRLRRDAMLVHVALVPYLVTAVALLKGTVEYGAYTLPMSMLLAWLAVRMLPRWTAWPCLGIGLVTAVLLAGPLRQDPAEARYASDALVLDHREGGIEVFAADQDEIDALGRCAPSIPTTWVLSFGLARAMRSEMFPVLCATWDQLMAGVGARGHHAVFTPGALAFLRAEPGLLARLMKEHVDITVAWRPTGFGSFRGFALEPR